MVWYGMVWGGNRGRAKKRLELAVSVSWDTCAASATGKKLGKTTQTLPCPGSPQETNNVCLENQMRDNFPQNHQYDNLTKTLSHKTYLTIRTFSYNPLYSAAIIQPIIQQTPMIPQLEGSFHAPQCTSHIALTA